MSIVAADRLPALVHAVIAGLCAGQGLRMLVEPTIATPADFARAFHGLPRSWRHGDAGALVTAQS